MDENPRIVLAGSVNSSRITLEKLLEHDMNVTGVLGLAPTASRNVSGYFDLETIANDKGLSYNSFEKINSDETVDFLKHCKPDYFFVIGLSQLIRETLLNIPCYGSVGFHPTKLPYGRGRAAVAWLILGEAPAATTFFLMGKGMDDGPILAQNEFDIGDNDYAADVVDKIWDSMSRGLDEMLPKLKKGILEAKEQNHLEATYLGKRNPEDGLINWSDSAYNIYRLIRAVSAPLPGAFTYYHDTKVIIDQAEIITENRYKGVVGSVLLNNDDGILIQTGDRHILIKKIRGLDENKLRVGQKLGIDLQAEIQKLKQIIHNLENIK